MTDRVQQMLDVVKQEFEMATRKPRGRRAKATMRAEVREGILKNPHLSPDQTPPGFKSGSRGLQGGQPGYSEPRHPDIWRNTSTKGVDLVVHPKGGLQIDPAKAALTAFQIARRQPAGKVSRQEAVEGLSLDRPRISEGAVKPLRRKARGRIILRGKNVDDSFSDSQGRSEKDGIMISKRRGSWIRALTGSRNRR